MNHFSIWWQFKFNKISNKICLINSYVLHDKLFYASKHACNLSISFLSAIAILLWTIRKMTRFCNLPARQTESLFSGWTTRLQNISEFQTIFLMLFLMIPSGIVMVLARFLTLDGRNLKKNCIYLSVVIRNVYICICVISSPFNEKKRIS